MANRLVTLPLLLAIVAGSVFTFNLGSSLLWDDDEPKNAACGREMFERADFIVPTFNDQLRDHKPVLLYWAMIASYSVFGVDEFGARLPSAIASVVTVLLCFFIGRRLYDRWSGFAAGLLLICGLMFAVLSRAATPDAVLIMCTTGAFFFFVRGVSNARGGMFSSVSDANTPAPLDSIRIPLRDALGMYVCMGFAVLAKGPIGVLLPMTVVGGYAVLTHHIRKELADDTGRFAAWFSWAQEALAPKRLLQLGTGLRVWMGAAIVAAVALPWYIGVTIATEGEWLAGFLGTHNVNRFLNPMEGHNGPIFYYIIAIMIGFFPGSCFLPVATFKAYQGQRKQSSLAQSHAFVLVWVGVYLVFFSAAATKLPNYIVPCYPALALITGQFLVSNIRSKDPSRFWLRIGAGSLAAAGAAIVAALAYFAVNYVKISPTIAAIGLIPILGGIVGFILIRKHDLRPSMATMAATGILFTCLATGLVAPHVSVFQLSPQVAANLSVIEDTHGRETTKFATYHYTRPNIVFYLGHAVEAFKDDDEVLEFFATKQNRVMVLPKEVYARLDDQLPENVSVLRTMPEFLEPEQEVLIIGSLNGAKNTAVANLDSNEDEAIQR